MENDENVGEDGPEDDPKSKDHNVAVAEDSHKSTRKRRKVNHACVYCRRSHMTCDLERPCTRCIKRNIGHLCHDEPRDAESKKSRSVVGASVVDESESQSDIVPTSRSQPAISMAPPAYDGSLGIDNGQVRKAAFEAAALGQGTQLVQPHVTGMPGSALGNSSTCMNQFAGFSDAWLTAHNHFHDIHNYHPNYMITPEVTNEFDLLNDFLHTSLLDEGVLPDEPNPELGQNQSQAHATGLRNNEPGESVSTLPPSTMPGGPLPTPNAELAKGIPRPRSAIPTDKAREYYLQAADPAGNDAPQNRMERVLQAKYDAGLLKPFNYINGYKRLNTYLDGHVAPESKQNIIRQLNRFRPKFRDKMEALTDMDLIIVEMWFEKTLMEYDRVFASMAVPACCWRRTGEIFRGNREMAELIKVPVEKLRDGTIALHQILTEDSVVRYWEEFGTIAFDPDHDTLLTSCSLKNPDDGSRDPVIDCCFSFMIRRDDHKVPSLITGNFLPQSSKSIH